MCARPPPSQRETQALNVTATKRVRSVRSCLRSHRSRGRIGAILQFDLRGVALPQVIETREDYNVSDVTTNSHTSFCNAHAMLCGCLVPPGL